MEEIIRWQIEMEKRAEAIYERCAELLEKEKELSQFLRRLAQDERRHAQVMLEARNCIAEKKPAAGSVTLDSESRLRIEAPMDRIEQSLHRNTVTRQEALGFVAEAEHSELNHLFLYVVQTLMPEHPRFSGVANEIQRHLEHIEDTLKNIEGGKPSLRSIQKLSNIRTNKILIIDDDESILELLTVFLSRVGTVSTAPDGATGEAMIRQTHFAAILSDVNMPGMSGVQLYEKMAAEDPFFHHRFIFMTGNADGAVRKLVDEAGLRLLFKPFALAEVQRVVMEVMAKNGLNAFPGTKKP